MWDGLPCPNLIRKIQNVKHRQRKHKYITSGMREKTANKAAWEQ